MKKSLKNKIMDKLIEYDIPIFNDFESENETIIVATNLNISIEKDEVFVSFYVGTEPSYAARIMIILHEIKEIKEFLIGEEFVFDQNGKYIEGEEAIEYDEKFKKQQTIQKFVEEQTQIYYLTNTSPFHC